MEMRNFAYCGLLSCTKYKRVKDLQLFDEELHRTTSLLYIGYVNGLVLDLYMLGMILLFIYSTLCRELGVGIFILFMFHNFFL